MELNDIVSQNIHSLSSFFESSENIILVILDRTYEIKFSNKNFRTKVQSKRFNKKTCFTDLLSDRSKEKLVDLVNSLKNDKVLLTFTNVDASNLSLTCHIFFENNTIIIIGGNLMLNNSDVLKQITVLNNEMANISRDLQRKNRQLEEANKKIKSLSGMIPICMHCKSIRNDTGYWDKLEEFITEHSEAEFSHGICPDCLEKYYGDLLKDEE